MRASPDMFVVLQFFLFLAGCIAMRTKRSVNTTVHLQSVAATSIANTSRAKSTSLINASRVTNITSNADASRGMGSASSGCTDNGACGLGIFVGLGPSATYQDAYDKFERGCVEADHPHPPSLCKELADEGFKTMDMTAIFAESPETPFCKSIKRAVEAHIQWVQEIAGIRAKQEEMEYWAKQQEMAATLTERRAGSIRDSANELDDLDNVLEEKCR